MINRKILLTFITISLIALPLVALGADPAKGLQKVDPFEGTSSGDLLVAIKNIVNALLAFAAVVAVIFVIIGGVRYIVSQGDEDQQVLAKNTVLYSVFGIIIIALSAVIINFIITYI